MGPRAREILKDSSSRGEKKKKKKNSEMQNQSPQRISEGGSCKSQDGKVQRTIGTEKITQKEPEAGKDSKKNSRVSTPGRKKKFF